MISAADMIRCEINLVDDVFANQEGLTIGAGGLMYSLIINILQSEHAQIRHRVIGGVFCLMNCLPCQCYCVL